MLTKCFGIISYLPDIEPLRTKRKDKLTNLIKTLDKYFKLPVVIVAQNWREEDFQITYSAPIKIYSYPQPLGITKARITLREMLLKEDYDYFIYIDDDGNIICNQSSVKAYLHKIDMHPDMFGLFKGWSWHRLLAISKTMLELMSYDFIKDYESIRGEIWEDVAYIRTYKVIYPDKWYIIRVNGMDEKQPLSEDDPDTTWYKPELGSNKDLRDRTERVIEEWIKYLREA